MAHHQRQVAHAGAWKCLREKHLRGIGLCLHAMRQAKGKQGKDIPSVALSKQQKEEPDCANKVNSQADKVEKKGLRIWKAHQSQQRATKSKQWTLSYSLPCIIKASVLQYNFITSSLGNRTNCHIRTAALHDLFRSKMTFKIK